MADVIAWMKLDELSTKIDAKLAANMTEVQTKLDALEATVQSKLDAAKTAQDAALSQQAEEIDALKALVERGPVKSIQSGQTQVKTGSTNASTYNYTTVAINKVDMSKSFIFFTRSIWGSTKTGSNNTSSPDVGVIFQDDSTLLISGYGASGVAWTVVEFY